MQTRAGLPAQALGIATIAAATISVLAARGAAIDVTDTNLMMSATVPFMSGQDGYHTYRIPAILKLADGRLVLFCEGRKLSSADHGWNDIVAKVSVDSGITWGSQQLVYGESSPGKNVCIGNPSPVALQGSQEGTILLAACRNNINVLTMTGTFKPGSTEMEWTTPADISSSVVAKNWTFVATGPPQGLQLASGRIIISADHVSNPGKLWGSQAFYSDDVGKSWSTSNIMNDGNECQAAVLKNGTLIMNQRTPVGFRQFSWSHNDGTTWSQPTQAPFAFAGKYAGGGCEGSTIAVREGSMLLFSTPFASSRSNMTVFMSKTGGVTWEHLYNVDTGPSAYSALVDLNATHYGLAYERGGYASITFVVLPLPPV